MAAHKTYDTAIFAGGCFWCVEDVFENQPGIESAISGYTGGTTKNPTYEEVSAGGTGHFEAVQITYDPKLISYEDLLALFWVNIDPFDDEGQFCDTGPSYKAAIFPRNEQQTKAAQASKKEIEKKLGRPVVTQIIPASTFYPAEEYHQDYAQKNPYRYSFYSFRCGRKSRLKKVWGNKDES